MAKFRINHEPKKKARFFLVRLIAFAAVLIFLLLQVLKFFKKFEETSLSSNTLVNRPALIDTVRTLSEGWKDIGLPTIQGQNRMIRHQYYFLSYSEQDEQAEWVAYILTRENLNKRKLHRFNYFDKDDMIQGGSSNHFDYMGSGYTRGHLAPASDMSFDSIANKESFYMSNISPQVREFNQGIWRELEENVRDWARSNEKLFVVTGPVLKADVIKKIGKNQVTVPSLFYKVVLCANGTETKGIGFIIPNTVSDKPLNEYIYPIDSIEQITGINFFNTIPPSSFIEEAEKSVFKNNWPINKKRYNQRITVWNKINH
ncbi:MAG: DNA/RNA non-specific endonuclease [Saprospiraceae bacterium]